MTNDQAYDFVIAIATGALDDIPSMADVVAADAAPRS